MNSENKATPFFVVKILGIFTLILILITLLKSLSSNISSNYTFTFQSFLEFLQNAPGITPKFSLSEFTITADWGLFDFLRIFLNFFAKIYGFATWFTILIWNAIVYVSYFFTFIFAL